jgi:hypothetical protein
MTRVIVHIDRLLLNGLQRADATAIAAGLQRELEVRLAGSDAREALAARGSIRKLNGGRVSLGTYGDIANIGRALGDRIIREPNR